MKRLFPVFLLFIVSYLYFIVGIRDEKTLFTTTLLHISGLSSFTAKSFAWYIPATIFIYWSFPIWFYTVRWLESRHKYAIWIFLMSFLVVKPLMIPYVFWLLNGRFVMVILGILTYIWLHDRAYNKGSLAMLFTIPTCLAVLFGQGKTEIVGLSLPLIFLVIDMAGIKHYGNRFLSFVGKNTLSIYLAQVVAIEALTPAIISEWFIHYLPNNMSPLCVPMAMIAEIIGTIFLAYILFVVQDLFWRCISIKNKTL